MERIFETQQVTKSDHCSLLISVVLGGTSPPDREAGPSSLSPPFTCCYYLYCFNLYLSYGSFRFLLVPAPSLSRPEQYLPHYPIHTQSLSGLFTEWKLWANQVGQAPLGQRSSEDLHSQ